VILPPSAEPLKVGAGVAYFGRVSGMVGVAPTRISFTRIPGFDRRVN
jgi:hypothetical protein